MVFQSPTMKIDSKTTHDLFNQRLKELIRNVPLSANDIIKNEARLLLSKIMVKMKPRKAVLSKERIPKAVQFAYNQGFNDKRATRAFKYRGKWKHLDNAGKEKLIKDQIKKIGWFSAGFIGSGNPLNATVAEFVKRQKGEGETKITGDGRKWRVLITNKTRFIAHSPKMYRFAIDIINTMIAARAKLMKGNLRAIMKGRQKYRIPAEASK